MTKKLTEKNVWTEMVSARDARKVARALKEVGYGSATIEKCRGYVINIAQYFEPGDSNARSEVIRVICETTGIQPKHID